MPCDCICFLLLLLWIELVFQTPDSPEIHFLSIHDSTWTSLEAWDSFLIVKITLQEWCQAVTFIFKEYGEYITSYIF